MSPNPPPSPSSPPASSLPPGTLVLIVQPTSAHCSQPPRLTSEASLFFGSQVDRRDPRSTRLSELSKVLQDHSTTPSSRPSRKGPAPKSGNPSQASRGPRRLP